MADLMPGGANRDNTWSRRPGRAAGAAASVLAAAILVGCSTVDPYEVTCGELIDSPDTLRETTLKLADKNVKAKVRYEREIATICETAPKSYRPAQKVKPEKQ